MTVRFGIISFAHMHADSYAWALKQIAETDGVARLVAIADLDEQRGRSKAKQYGADMFCPDYFAILRPELIDAVIICSENSLHEEHVIAAAKRKIHVLCEKPLGVSFDALKNMKTAVEKNDVVFQSAFVCRFSPPVVEAKRVIESGRLGPIRAISSTNHGRCPYGWFVQRELSGGGAVIDHTVHCADIIRMLTKEELVDVRAFRGRNIREDIDVEDTALVYARTDKTNIPISIDCSWSRDEKFPIWGDLTFNIFCENGTMRIDAFKPLVSVAAHGQFRWQSVGEDWNQKLIRSMVNAIRERDGDSLEPASLAYVNDPSLRAGFDDAAQAAMVALNAYRSIENKSARVARH